MNEKSSDNTTRCHMCFMDIELVYYDMCQLCYFNKKKEQLKAFQACLINLVSTEVTPYVWNDLIQLLVDK